MPLVHSFVPSLSCQACCGRNNIVDSSLLSHLHPTNLGTSKPVRLLTTPDLLRQGHLYLHVTLYERQNRRLRNNCERQSVRLLRRWWSLLQVEVVLPPLLCHRHCRQLGAFRSISIRPSAMASSQIILHIYLSACAKLHPWIWPQWRGGANPRLCETDKSEHGHMVYRRRQPSDLQRKSSGIPWIT